LICTHSCWPVPAPARGFVVGTYQFSLGIGGFVINAICYGTSFLNDDRAWRIPLGLFYIIPTIILSFVWFIPESPRWLLRKDRVDEARQMLWRLRQGPFTDEEIEAEFAEIKFTLDREVEQGKFRELWNAKNLKRTMIVVTTNFFQQASGQAFTSQYGAIFIRSLGIMKPQLFAFVKTGIAVVMNGITLFSNDVFGRR
jgi:MFS transporter, SP family, sugar:H+ symporter